MCKFGFRFSRDKVRKLFKRSMELVPFGMTSKPEYVGVSKKIPCLAKYAWRSSSTTIYTFQLGEVVWAQMSGYPSWPAIIEADPNSKTFFSKNGDDECYHVTFLDKVVTRHWINRANLHPFTLKDELRLSHKKRTQMERNLQLAFANAKQALTMCVEERLNTFGFANCYPLRSTVGNGAAAKIPGDTSAAFPNIKVATAIQSCHDGNTMNHQGAIKVDKENVSMATISEERSNVENGNEIVEREDIKDLAQQPKKFKKAEIKDEKETEVTGKGREENEKKRGVKKEKMVKGEKNEVMTVKKKENIGKEEEEKNTFVLENKMDYKLYKMGCDYDYLR